jgi:hypothetical protein
MANECSTGTGKIVRGTHRSNHAGLKARGRTIEQPEPVGHCAKPLTDTQVLNDFSSFAAAEGIVPDSDHMGELDQIVHACHDSLNPGHVKSTRQPKNKQATKPQRGP